VSQITLSKLRIFYRCEISTTVPFVGIVLVTGLPSLILSVFRTGLRCFESVCDCPQLNCSRLNAAAGVASSSCRLKNLKYCTSWATIQLSLTFKAVG
jgi:hypothetical protein